MGSMRTFASIGSFVRFLDERTAALTVANVAIGTASARTLRRTVRKNYGSHALEDLADATQTERIAKGYTPNDPLKRTGELLRDSTEMAMGEDIAAVGSSEPVAAYHEYGYINARTGRAVPPRPVYKMSLEEAAPKIATIIEENIGFALGVVTVKALGDDEGADYALTVSKE